MSVHQVHEVDCSIDAMEPEVVEAFLAPEDAVRSDVQDQVARLAPILCSKLSPKGVYKLFNPAPCVLPPKYTTHAVKLVGTLAVLNGETAYERLYDAVHAVMALSTIGADEEVEDIRRGSVEGEAAEVAFAACLEAMTSLVADRLADAVADDAHSRGLHRGSTLEPGTEDLPLATNDTLVFFTQADRRLGLECDEAGVLTRRWSTTGVMGIYDSTQKKRRGCAHCHNVKTCTIRKIGMTCHGRRTRPKRS